MQQQSCVTAQVRFGQFSSLMQRPITASDGPLHEVI